MAASPCINVCQMDEQTGFCAGCYRSLDEIAAWARLDDGRQVDILAAVARRRLEHDPWEGEFRGDCDRHG